MRKRILCTALVASVALAACSNPASTQTTAVPGMEEASSTGNETRATGGQENQDTIEAETEASGEPYKIGIVIPTLTVSEDELRSAQEMVQRYPGLVAHKTLSKSFATDREGCISVVISLADNLEMECILFNNRMKGIIPAFRTIGGRRSGIVTAVTSNDGPEPLNDYADISISADWIRRGKVIPTRAHDMGTRTLIHYSFPAHMATESKAKRRDVTKKTCEKSGMTWVEETTPGPRTGNGTAVMLQSLKEDIPRKIEQHGSDANIFGVNCPMYAVSHTYLRAHETPFR